jgi:hypothetical protein
MKHMREQVYFKLRLCGRSAGAGTPAAGGHGRWHYGPELLELSEPG